MTIPACTGEPHPPLPEQPLVSSDVRERAARMLAAAGDPARLAILELLAERELCVTDLVAMTGDAMPTVSHRLRVLRAERLVRTRRERKHVFYALADAHVLDLLRTILHHAAERGR